MEERWAGVSGKSKKNKATALLKIASSQRKEDGQEEEQKVKKHKATIYPTLCPSSYNCLNTPFVGITDH